MGELEDLIEKIQGRLYRLRRAYKETQEAQNAHRVAIYKEYHEREEAFKGDDPKELVDSIAIVCGEIRKAQEEHTRRMAMLQDQADRKSLSAKHARGLYDTRVIENVDLRTQLDKARDDLKALNLKIDALNKIKYALGRKGFRGEVLDQVTPYLNNRTQHYLEGLSDGNIEATWTTIDEDTNGDYRENFQIQVRHKSGVDNFAGLSGGEKRKVRLACALALQDLVATRAVKPIKLFIADEVDDALDAAGLELLMGILEAKAREVGSVFIISHNDLADWVRNKITVTKEHGVSTFSDPS
jgi:DNA repair exonuclease SbcCD ATPase subunit